VKRFVIFVIFLVMCLDLGILAQKEGWRGGYCPRCAKLVRIQVVGSCPRCGVQVPHRRDLCSRCARELRRCKRAGCKASWGIDKKDEKQLVKERIKKFRDQLRRAKEPRAKIDAINELTSIKHQEILKELLRYLYTGGEGFRKVIIKKVSEYKGERLAAKGLIQMVDRYKRGTKWKHLVPYLLEHIGKLGYKPVALKINPLIGDPDLEIACAAVKALKHIRNKASIEPLIRLLAQLERIEIKDYDPDNPRDPKRLLFERKQRLMQPIKDTLASLIGQYFETAGEYNDWWKKNKRDFKIED
jgi:hypothetical protein